MAFTGDGRKLTGSDGTIYKATFGTEVTGDGIATLPVGIHLITAVAGPTGWPVVSGATGAVAIEAGYLIRARTGVTITPAIGDKYKTVTLSELCDIASWTLPFTADEIETTTFCDLVKTYEVGKTDIAGSVSGITTIGTTTGPGGFLQQFTDIIQQDGSTSMDLFKKESAVLFGYFVANDNTSKGDELAYFAPINVFSASLGGDQGSAQTFDSSVRVASYTDDTGVIVRPGLYRFAL